MRISEAKFAGSSVTAANKPSRKLPEFAFIGRSNVGKSSLINMLCGNSKLAKTSSTPGKTKLINHFMVRHFAKPGITGLAQVSGFRGETRYIDQMEGRVKKDIEYIENWTFLLDLKIIVKTVTNMLGKEKGNAY